MESAGKTFFFDSHSLPMVESSVAEEPSDGVYCDVAIPPPERAQSEVLQRCLKMRELRYAPGLGGSPKAVAFYLQGKFMEDFQDSFDEAVHFSGPFPTYQDMDYRQLRAYFSWRTAFRLGQAGADNLSFLFVTVYELLNQIGVATPEEGFRSLWDLWQRYRSAQPLLDRYLPLWLRDYCAYYGLPPDLLKPLEEGFDGAALVLWDWKGREDPDLFEALQALSGYDLEGSKLYKARGQDFRFLAARIYRSLAAFWESRGESFCQHLLGPMASRPYEMFRAAPFCHRLRREEYLYEVSAVRRYRCQGRQWFQEGFPAGAKTRHYVGALLKAIDGRMRIHLNFGAPLKDLYLSRTHGAIVDREINAYLEEQRQGGKVTVDLSRLAKIRSDALVIQQKLTAYDGEPSPGPEIQSPQAQKAPEDRDGAQEGVLQDLEGQFLAFLLEGRPWKELLRRHGKALSVVMDSINEKLLELLGDTALVQGPQGPQILEDYSAAVKGLVKPWQNR